MPCPRLTLALLLVCAPGLVAGAERCRDAEPYPRTPHYGYSHDRFGTRPVDIERRFAAFEVSFDSADADGTGPRARAVPEWVAYQLKASERTRAGFLAPAGRKPPARWYHDEALAFLFDAPGIEAESLEASYAGERVYTRGQLVAKAHADRISWQAGCNTHSYLNTVPQLPGFRDGIWRHLDHLIGAWANKYGSVWVIAGPVFYRGRQVFTIGEAGEVPVAIPHAYFRVVARRDPGQSVPEVLAFLYPPWDDQKYKTGDCHRDGGYDHSAYLVPVRQIEGATGLQFFANLRSVLGGPPRFKTRPAPGVWPAEEWYFSAKC